MSIGGEHSMRKVHYVMVDADILPEVYSKVLAAKKYLATGEAASAKEAAVMAGVSRSAYYKYKDAIFEYGGEGGDEIATVKAKLQDSAGVLSAFMTELYQAGTNVLSVNQSMPEDGVADVTVTVRISEMSIPVADLPQRLNRIDGVVGAALSK